MANEMPSSADYSGLTRTVIQYSEAFTALVDKAKHGALSDADWEPIEQLVDVAAFERQGVFLTAKAETFGWSTYKSYISQFGGATSWEGTLRRVTEQPNLVILELEERIAQGGQPRLALSPRTRAPAVPDIAGDVVVIAAARHEARAGIVHHQVEAELSDIEGLGLRRIADAQMDVAHAGAARHAGIRLRFRLAQELL